jgi:hypothetical protein
MAPSLSPTQQKPLILAVLSQPCLILALRLESNREAQGMPANLSEFTQRFPREIA